MDKDTALDLALEALEKSLPRLAPYGEQDWLDSRAAITAIKQARSAPVQESVAYRFKERPDDLRSAWRYVSKKQHVPHGWPYQSLGITGETKWTNNN
jgi:hypothetical protein